MSSDHEWLDDILAGATDVQRRGVLAKLGSNPKDRLFRILLSAASKVTESEPPPPLPPPAKPSRSRPKTNEEKAARLKELAEELDGESDRGFVLVLHCHLDAQLASVFRMIAKANGESDTEINELMGMLWPFRTKLRVASAFGVLTLGLAEALLEFNELRNDAAHADQRFHFSVSDIQPIAKHLGGESLDSFLEEAARSHNTSAVARAILSQLAIKLAEVLQMMTEKGILSMSTPASPTQKPASLPPKETQ